MRRCLAGGRNGNVLLIALVCAHAVAMAGGITGCTFRKPREIQPTRSLALSYLIIREHGAPNAHTCSTSDSGMAAAFRRSAAAGYNGILIRDPPPECVPLLAASATQAEITAIISHRALDGFISAGVLPSGAANAADVVALLRVSSGGARRPVVALPHPRSRAGQNRLDEVIRELAASGAAHVMLSGDARSTGGLAQVESPSLDDLQPDRSAMSLVLSQYHRSLLVGQTLGLVVRGVDYDFSDSIGATPRDGVLAQTAALRELVVRAHHWGPRIVGLTARPVPVPERAPDQLATALLSDTSRRFVLMMNLSPSEHVRGALELASDELGGRVTRAVEAPASTDRPVGTVVGAQGDTLTLTVDLNPGDAALYELF